MVRKKKVEESTYKDTDVLECIINISFTDKYTGVLYEAGKTIKFTYKRIKEIQDKNKDLIKIKEK